MPINSVATYVYKSSQIIFNLELEFRHISKNTHDVMLLTAYGVLVSS